VEPDGSLLLVTTHGFGKRCQLKLYAPKGRGTHGITTIDQKSLATIGLIATARVMQEGDEAACITRTGMVLRQKVSDIRTSGRGTRGLHLINVAAEDAVVSLARLLPDNLSTPPENGQPVEGGDRV
jgi:DNA gyrase subunit A